MHSPRTNPPHLNVVTWKVAFLGQSTILTASYRMRLLRTFGAKSKHRKKSPFLFLNVMGRKLNLRKKLKPTAVKPCYVDVYDPGTKEAEEGRHFRVAEAQMPAQTIVRRFKQPQLEAHA
ncbi:uncharacterized protein LOC122302779 [Carya illinoinensis]|uniref:uncharacterized protein LOC122302779 n=1 Tax=Carya illinoinensis TaxID=32201 RepID=UPI001C728B45|nr:uncharacterized protein LOC122302779 [Carya illinoinensis]